MQYNRVKTRENHLHLNTTCIRRKLLVITVNKILKLLIITSSIGKNNSMLKSWPMIEGFRREKEKIEIVVSLKTNRQIT